MKEITQEYLKFLFTYKDGFLYWKNINKYCHNRKNGDKAGSLNQNGYYNIKINIKATELFKEYAYLNEIGD